MRLLRVTGLFKRLGVDTAAIPAQKLLVLLLFYAYLLVLQRYDPH